MIKVNKILWFIPIVGLIHIVKLALKHGFQTPIENVNLFEAFLGNFIHALFILAPILLPILL